jgi:hypothetical protein
MPHLQEVKVKLQQRDQHQLMLDLKKLICTLVMLQRTTTMLVTQ